MRIAAATGWALVLLLSGPTWAVARDGLPKPMVWKVKRDRREAIVLFPDGPRNKPAPVVFAFHGHGTTMQHAARKFPIQKQWPEVIAVYLQGLPTASRVDPKGKRSGWQSEAGTEGNRDLLFVDAVLDRLRKKHAIDADRVYATGHSNGGGFTYVLYSARPGVFAAYAPIACRLRYPKNLEPRPAAVLHIAGKKDRTARIEEQMKTMAEVRKINGCRNAPVKGPSGCQVYAPKTRKGAPFVSFIHPGGHAIPPRATEMIIEFFKEHPRQRSRPPKVTPGEG